MAKVLEQRALNSTVTLLKVHAPLIAKKAQAGQFIILRLDDKGERIPLTIADFDPLEGSVTIIAQKVGLTTQLLSLLQPGDEILDFAGPLGRPTELSGIKRAVVVGGGVGTAIAYPQAKTLHNMGAHVDVIAGFRSRDIVILEDELKAICNNLYITTDDGSYGKKGFVTDVLKALLDAGETYDMCIAIGPVPMMKFLCILTKEYNLNTIVSLNPIMIDGTGMCGGCRVMVGGKQKFACVDGPDFDGHLVDFDSLINRNALYRQQEADHVCRMMEAANTSLRRENET